MSAETKPLYNARNFLQARCTRNVSLCGPGSDKDTRHIEISLAGSGLTYEAGDALAVKPVNDLQLVDLTLETLGFRGDEPVKVKDIEKPVREALLRDFQIHFAEKKFLAKLAEKGAKEIADLLLPENASALADYTSMWNASRDCVDVLRDFPGIRFTPQEFTDTLRALNIRLYSIASSLKAHPEQVDLTVAAVRWTAHGRARSGVCSTFLCERCSVGETTGVFGQVQKHFRMPENPDAPMIMVGPGTGVAPFRAFLEEREATGAKGKNWLFFGERRSSSEFFYKEQFEGWIKNGVLECLDLAWSRETEGRKEYVQHRMHAQGAQLWKWIADGAYFYVCGDKERMAKDVHEELIAIVHTHGGKSPEDARAFVEEELMKTEKRYRRDVY
jgi:sulfite reductase (NADPH) flavoprotein alpha-component